jgi:putative ABC transport system permease protein
VIRLLLRAAIRFYARHPGQLVLAILGIGLGVAVYVGVALANDSARRAFELSANAVLGNTTHQLLPLDARLPESIYADLVLGHGFRYATPVIEAELAVAGSGQGSWQLLGIDVLRAPRFGTGGPDTASLSSVAALLTSPGAVLIPEALAHELAVVPGDRFEFEIEGRRATAQVAGILSPAGQFGGARVVIADIATAQDWIDAMGYISRIDLILDDAQAATVAGIGIPDTVLVPAAARDRSFIQLRDAFYVNLTALSLLALFVGVFLVFTTLSFAVVQRRAALGVYRALGVSRRELTSALLAEAALMGGIATVVGLGLGHFLAGQLIGLVLNTVDDLSFRAELQAVPPSPLVYWQGLLLGLGASVAAGLAPALDAASTAPVAVMSRAALEQRSQRTRVRAAVLALACLGAALVVLALSRAALLPAFAALFLALSGAALLVPQGTRWLMRAFEPAASRLLGLPGALAVRSVVASLSRTGTATAALAVAFATVIGVSTMTASFRHSFDVWLDQTLLADIYLTDPDGTGALQAPLIESLAEMTGVAGMSRMRIRRLPTPEGDIELRAQAPGPRGWGLDVIQPDPEPALAALAAGQGVLVNEPFAFRRDLRPGESLTLPGPAGPVTLPIAGIYRDYSVGGNAVLIALARYRELWKDPDLSGIGLYLAAGTDPDTAAQAVAQIAAAAPGLVTRSTLAIKQRSLQVFDRTFRITDVLRSLAGVVAFLGMLSALLAIQLERARELAVLRALGLSPANMRLLILAQTGLLGLAAGLLALPIGLGLAALLIFVINQRSFGWSMDLVVTPGPLLAGLTLAVCAALLAGLYPAFSAVRGLPARALRAE